MARSGGQIMVRLARSVPTLPLFNTCTSFYGHVVNIRMNMIINGTLLAKNVNDTGILFDVLFQDLNFYINKIQRI